MTIHQNHLDSNWAAPGNGVDIKGPWRPESKTTVLLDCSGQPESAVVGTIRSILASTTQNLDVICLSLSADIELRIISWSSSDSRIKYEAGIPNRLPKEGAILAIHSGSIVNPFSIEALWEILRLPKISVIRSVVEGSNGTLEFWDAKWLSENGNRIDAETNARKGGHERWVSAEGLGIHVQGLPEPRLFFRRGAADRHIIDVVAYDSKSLDYTDGREREIRRLRGENAQLRRVIEGKKRRQPIWIRVAKRIPILRKMRW